VTQNIDMKELEKKAWTSYFQDGLLDIAIGMIMLAAVLSSTLDVIGISDEVRISIYIPLMVVVPPVIVILGKRYITIPRLGVARFGPHRKARNRIMIAGLVGTQLILLAMLALQWIYGVGSGWLGSIIVTLNILAAFCLIAYLLDYKRMYVIGILVAASEPVTFCLKNYSDTVYRGFIAYGIPAIIVMVMGFIVLRQFMREYEKPTMETPDAS
jgi:hypothetical protein